LLDVIAIGDPVIAEEVAVVPDFVDEIGSGGRPQASFGGENSIGRR
jgi:hypothetical protein